jgi:23S rRNA pseudouridine2605 synthase
MPRDRDDKTKGRSGARGPSGGKSGPRSGGKGGFGGKSGESRPGAGRSEGRAGGKPAGRAYGAKKTYGASSGARDERPRLARSYDDRPRQDRPRSSGPRQDRPAGDRPFKERSFEERPRPARSYDDKPRAARPYSGRTSEGGPRNAGAREDRPKRFAAGRKDERPTAARFRDREQKRGAGERSGPRTERPDRMERSEHAPRAPRRDYDPVRGPRRDEPRHGGPARDLPAGSYRRDDQGAPPPKRDYGEARPYKRDFDNERMRRDLRDNERSGPRRPSRFEERGDAGERPRAPRAYANRGTDDKRGSEKPRFEKRSFEKRDGDTRGTGERTYAPRKPREDFAARQDRGSDRGPERPRPPRRFEESAPRGRSRDDAPRARSTGRNFDRDASGPTRPARDFDRGFDRGAERFSRDAERAPRDFDRNDRPNSRPRRVRDENAAPPAPRKAAEKTGERIAKIVARAGMCSRRDAEAWIADGRVAVNGRIITSPALDITPGDVVTIDGEKLPPRERTRLFLYHKPRGLVTTHADPEGRETVFEALPKDLPRVISVGRLDYNTEGLLLLTNDGGLARALELPQTGWLRRYRVRAHGNITQPQLDALNKGAEIDGVRYGEIDAKLEREQGANVWITFSMREGKNREVRNVLGALGLDVNRLIRVSYGPFQLGELPEGGVEEVPARVLREQLGEKLVALSGADFESGIEADRPQKRGKRVSLEAGHGVREKRHGLIADSKGRRVLVERTVKEADADEQGEFEQKRRPARKYHGANERPAASPSGRKSDGKPGNKPGGSSGNKRKP